MKRNTFNCTLASVAAVTIWLPATALAATIAVTTTADNGPGSLRQAIQDAASGDTVNVTVTGIITLTNGQLSVTNDLNISGPGATNLALSGNYRSRIFEVGSNSAVNISGLMIRDGRAPAGSAHSPSGANGGGICNLGNLVLTACKLIGNTAGSGIQGFDGCNMFGCFAGWGGPGGSGGGVYNGGRITLVRCSFSGNSAGRGGDGGSAYTAGPGGPGGDGGGIYNASTLPLTILACTFDGNSGGGGGVGGYGFTRAPGGSGGSGGAIYNLGLLIATGGTFGGNSGGQEGLPGGGAFPGGGGGAIFNGEGQMTLIASTFSSNFSFSNSGFPSSAGGGGLYNSGSSVILRNVIVAGNTFNALSGAGCDLSGAFTSQGYNLIGNADGSSGFTNGINGDLTGTTAARLDAKLSALQDNGGPTWTMALSPDSPALNHGDDALLTAPFDLPDDQRGLPRKSATHVDIGAYELQAPNLVELRRSESDIAITFTTEVDWNYRLQRTDVLGSGSWTTVADNLVGTGRTVQVLDTGAATQPQYFYRAVMLP